jgi:hypothetical protein
MARLLTEKQEQFCELVVRIGNRTTAYKMVYGHNPDNPVSVRVNACMIYKKPQIQKRIAELRKERIDQIAVSPEWVVQKHVELFEEAREKSRISDARRNLRDLGETMGLYRDNLMVTRDLREFSDEEIKESILAAIAECQDKGIIKDLIVTLKESWDKLKNEGSGGQSSKPTS